ncbi:MAG: CHASE2 domain-containing protein, partial [Cyanobacteriota bacterium]
MWLKLRRQIGRWRGVLFTAPSVAGVVIFAASTGWFQLLEWVTLDQFFRLRPQEPIDSRIVIVTVDDSDLERVGQWPIPDETLAKLITKLNAQKPRAIGLDLYRNLPVEPGHQELEKVFKTTPNLIGVEKVVKNKVAPPPTLKQFNQVAIADLVLDADGKVRRGLLSVKPKNSKTRESLGVKLALKYLEAEGITLRMVHARNKQLGLGKAVFSPFTGNDGSYVRANSGGYQILLNFRGKPENFRTVSLTQVLKNQIPSDLVRDRVVLIGGTGQSLNDLFLTPYSSTFFTSPERMPGVFVHANLTSQILSAAIDGRVLIKTWVDSIEWLWILGWSFTGAVGHWMLLQTKVSKNNVSPKGTLHSIYLVLTGGSLIAVSYFAFLNGWWIPVVSPLLALAGSAIGIALYHSFELQQEKADLEILLETTTEHYDTVAADLQHQAEEAVRESERRLAQFLEAVSVGVSVIDAAGKPYFANQRAQELLGKGVVASVTIDELAQVYQYYIAGTDRVYPVEHLPIVQAWKGKRTTADDIEIHRGEQIIPIEAWGTPIYDEQGKIAYAIAAFQDITERKRSEEALRQAEQKYRQIFENALEGIFQTTLDGRFQSANPALA